MSDRTAILGGRSDSKDSDGLTFKDVAHIAHAHTHLSRKHRKKMHKRLTGFERRYSKLALDKTLVTEKKRIDFVLVHPKKMADDAEDKEEKEILEEHQAERARFLTLLVREGFTVQQSVMGDFVYSKLHCPFKRLCREAERVKFEMPLKDCPKLESVTQSSFTKFVEKHFETDDEEDFISTAFFMNKIEKFEGHEDPNTFFRPAVRSVLTHHILINLNLDDLDKDQKTEEELNEASKTPQNKKGVRYMLLKKHYVDAFTLHEESARSSIRGDNYLTDEGASQRPALLTSDPRKDLDDTWPKPFKFQPMWKIRNYFGERIAFYFAWSGMLISTLWIPTIFGLCVFFYGLHESLTNTPPTTNGTSLTDSFKDLFADFKASFDNDVTPYFGLVICVWGTVFLELWKRKRAELAYEWDVDQFESNEPDRPQFSGTHPKKDPVTDEWVWFYPLRRQIVKYSFSFSVLIVMIFMVLISVVSIIVYRVIIDIDYCPTMAASQCLVTTTVISSILNAISILFLGKVYNWLAMKLTKWENHRTQTQFDDALIFKLFAFQFVNSYASCFYIAFFRGNVTLSILSDKYKDTCEGSCMTQLSFQVLVLMVAKPFPKFFKDIILVWLKRFLRKHPGCCPCLRKLPFCAQPSPNQVGTQDPESGEDGEGKPKDKAHEAHLLFLQHEHFKPKLGDFTLEEYMEKIIQYGFLMLFATSFPLAPLLALVTNMFDLRVDAKRLLWWYRRPIAFVAQDIGMWYHILLFVNFCGVVSNAFIIAFTSSWGAKYSTSGKLLIVIGFEHIVFLLKYIVAYLIPDVPANVQLSIRREQYQIQKKMEDKQHKGVDYSHLFPSDIPNAIHEEDEDEDGGGDGVRKPKPSPTHGFHQSAKQEPTKSTQVMYRFNSSRPTSGRRSGEDGGYDKVSASDVKPQGKQLWTEMDEMETRMSKSTRVHSPNYPKSDPRGNRQSSSEA